MKHPSPAPIAPVRPVWRCALAALLLSTLVCGVSVASAQTISGKIDFTGVVTYDTTSLATATQVSLWNASVVSQRTGDFANPTYSIDPMDPATMAAPWIFNSGTPATPAPGPATPALWSIGGFTFDLTSSMVVSQDATFLDVSGVGTISGNGFDPTPGTWSFSSTKSDGGQSSTFGFTAQSAAVPEPASVLLFASGLALAAGINRLRNGPRAR